MHDEVVILGAGASLSCPAGKAARVANPDRTVLVLSELQIGGRRAAKAKASSAVKLEHFVYAAE
jgi:hypothetical protein